MGTFVIRQPLDVKKRRGARTRPVGGGHYRLTNKEGLGGETPRKKNIHVRKMGHPRHLQVALLTEKIETQKFLRNHGIVFS